MKWIVGIVAATAVFTGCGVGVDDPEGMAAAGFTDFALEASSVIPVDAEPTVAPTREASPTPQVGGRVGTSSTQIGGGTVSAPQDPIPAFDPRLQQVVGVPTYPTSR